MGARVSRERNQACRQIPCSTIPKSPTCRLHPRAQPNELSRCERTWTHSRTPLRDDMGTTMYVRTVKLRCIVRRMVVCISHENLFVAKTSTTDATSFRAESAQPNPKQHSKGQPRKIGQHCTKGAHLLLSLTFLVASFFRSSLLTMPNTCCITASCRISSLPEPSRAIPVVVLSSGVSVDKQARFLTLA